MERVAGSMLPRRWGSVIAAQAPVDCLCYSLCDSYPGQPGTTREHIEALHRYSRHDVKIFTPRGIGRSRYLDLNEFDVVIIHYSLVIISDYYLAPHFREQLRQFSGLKILFIQDEYRWVNAITAMIRYLGINVLFTLLPSSEVSKVYNETTVPGVEIVESLAGYASDGPAGLSSSFEDRPIDIGYRGRTLPYWLGRHAQDKVWIGQEFLRRAGPYGLRCDIGWAERDRIYGEQWIRFLGSCKATLGTESGASIVDFDGSIESRTSQYLAGHPSASFEEVWKAILEPHEGNVQYFMISPRMFEAAALRTALILFPGQYSGIIKPEIHYIPLAKDFSNVDEVVQRLRDPAFITSMTDRTYEDLVASGRFSHRALGRDLDQAIARYPLKARRRIKIGYRLAVLEEPTAQMAEEARGVVVTVNKKVRLALYNLWRGTVSLGLMLASAPRRRVLFRWMTKPTSWRAVPLGNILRDVLKLAMLGQMSDGRSRRDGTFHVSLSLDVTHGALTFESFAAEDNDQNRLSSSVRDDIWPLLGRAILEGHVRQIIWNHPVGQQTVRFAMTPSIGFRVCVGDSNRHSFDALVTLGQHFPREVLGLFAEMFRVDWSAIDLQEGGQMLSEAK
jgi:hypothetical protein